MQVELKDLLEIRNGADYRNIDEGDVPVYGSGGQITSINKWLYDGESILLPRKGTLDNILFVYGKFWTIDTMYWSIVNKNKVVPYYLYNYLRILRFNNLHTGSTLPSMTTKAYYSIKLDLPSLDIQKKVAYVLKILDSKIELNNKINEELEKIAKTLYDYWFVQFDFPDENNRPYKSSGGAMVYNEELKREIPKGWEVKELREIAPISNEQLTPEEDVVYRYYSIPDYDRQGTYVLDYGKNIHSNKFVVLPCDVLVSKLNPRFCRVICAGNKTKMISSTEFVVFRCNTETNQTLIRSIAVSDSFRDFCIANATGSSGSHNRIRPDIMGSFKIPYKDSVCNSFKNRLSSVIQKLLLVTQEKRELSELRDFLLPMLMNGQVKVI